MVISFFQEMKEWEEQREKWLKQWEQQRLQQEQRDRQFFELSSLASYRKNVVLDKVRKTNECRY